MRRRLPPLNAMRSFEATGRHLSVTKAADELCVTEPAVSKAIRVLEEHFDVRLFERTKTGLVLTEQGKMVLPRVTSALDELGSVSQQLYQSHNRSITILTTPYFAARFIAPNLTQLTSLAPNLNISLKTSFRYEQLENAEFDVAIWYGAGMRRGFEKHALCNFGRLPVCSRGYADVLNLWDCPDRLNDATLLHEFDYSFWEAWCAKADVPHINFARGVVTDQFETTIRAARASAGIGLLFDFTPRVELGELVMPFGSGCKLDVDYWLFTREDTDDDPLIEETVSIIRSLVSSASLNPTDN